MPQSHLLAACTALLIAVPALLSDAAALVDTRIDVPSHTLTDAAFLRGDASTGTPVTLSGRLIMPEAEGGQPVVILLHGSDGPNSRATWLWQEWLNSKGFATFTLDSYSARGFDAIGKDQNRVAQFVQLYDAYRAADTLAGHPRVDASRIVLMGFSRGGTASLYAAMARFQNALGPRKAKIVGYLPFYPACNFELGRELEMSGAPIRLFHGTADDSTPIEPCRRYVQRLRTAGQDVVLTEYEGARHAFDDVSSPAYIELPDVQTSRNCLRREMGGDLVNPETGKPFNYSDPCVERGVSLQYNAAATDAARRAVPEFLNEVLAGK